MDWPPIGSRATTRGSVFSGFLASVLTVSCNSLWGIDDLRYGSGGAPGGASTRGAGAPGAGGNGAAGATTGDAGGQACGNGQVDSGEKCDDGNESNTDACPDGPGGTCLPARCGDSFVQEAVEECDDGNESNTDACLNDCILAKCGDGLVREGVEECDDGDLVTDGCTDCIVACSAPGEFKHPTTVHCYRLVTQTIKWPAAASDCLVWGGYLAAITTLEEQNFLLSSGVPDLTWIGGHDTSVEGTFTWLSGEPWDFSYWAPGEPNDGGGDEDCVQMGTPGLIWNDLLCTGFDEHYLCERTPAGATQ